MISRTGQGRLLCQAWPLALLLLGAGLAPSAALASTAAAPYSLDLPHLPSALDQAERRKQESADCGAFCVEPLGTALDGRLGVGKGSVDTQDAWGVFRNPDQMNGPLAPKNRFAFTGYLFDRETELYFAKARFYDPEVGRFTSQDSFLGEINNPPSLHRFAYANANPLRYIDPTGHAARRPQAVVSDEGYYVPVPQDGAYVEVHADPIKQLDYEVRTGQRSAGEAVVVGTGQIVKPLNDLGNDAAIRGMGAARAVGGGVQVAVGAAGLAAPEPTMVTKVAGAVAITHGVDDLQAGLRQAWTGQVTETLTGVAIRKTAEKAGASPQTAAVISAVGETAIAGGASGLSARGIPAQQLTTLGPISPETQGASSGPVILKLPPNATQEQIAQARAYCEGCNEALKAGELSSTGRVSTTGQLRREATRAAAKEKARAAEAGQPYQGHPGHVPDTTWTGTPEPWKWLDLDPKVNLSLGGQAPHYPVGFKPTEFILEEP